MVCRCAEDPAASRCLARPVSLYRGALVLWHPFRGKGSFSFWRLICMDGSLAGRDARAFLHTLHHEYGHCLQFRALGLFRYLRYIARPSLRGYHSQLTGAAYLSQPWEYDAELRGGDAREAGFYTPEAAARHADYFAALPKSKKEAGRKQKGSRQKK